MTSKSSYKQIIQASTIIGGSSLVNILINIVRVKVLAALLGPAGVGLMGTLSSIMGNASTLAGVGLAESGIRQLARSDNSPAMVARIRRTMWIASLTLGSLGGFAVFLLSVPIAKLIFDDAQRSQQVAWLGIGVFLTVVAGLQTAVLQGLQRIGDMAWASIISAVLGTAGGIFAVWQYQESGIVAFVLIGPLFAVLVTRIYVMRLPAADSSPIELKHVQEEWSAMFGLGLVFVSAALMTNVSGLVVRALVARELGLDATGYFQAAWGISMQYIGIVLAAMATDFYPRLTQAIDDRAAANRLVEEQAEVSVLIAGPIMILMLAIAPLVITVLYSGEFSSATEVLRWQVLGDIIKVAGWPMGFILAARGERMLFFITQLIWNAGYILLVWLGLPYLGLKATGIAFLICYAVAFLINCAIVYRINGFRYSNKFLISLLKLSVIAVFVFLLSMRSELAASIFGSIAAVIVGIFNFRRIILLAGPDSRLGAFLHRLVSK